MTVTGKDGMISVYSPFRGGYHVTAIDSRHASRGTTVFVPGPPPK